LPEQGAVRLVIAPILQFLVRGIGADALGGGRQRVALRQGNGLCGLCQTGAGDGQCRRARGLPAVEAGGELDECGIAAAAHGVDDVVDGALHTAVGDRLPGQQGVEPCGEIGVGGAETGDVGHGDAPVSVR